MLDFWSVIPVNSTTSAYAGFSIQILPWAEVVENTGATADGLTFTKGDFYVPP